METSEIIRKVRRIEIRTGRLVDEFFAGKYHSAFKGRGIEFSEVREYEPGDDPRDIDWNVTARFSKPYIKKYSEERELNLLILCDISASQFFGSRYEAKNELSAEIAATFAFSAIRNGDKAGLLLFSENPELYLPPKKGKSHYLRIIRELVAGSPRGRGTSVANALDEANRILKRKSIIVLISDFRDEGYRKSLSLARLKHDVIPVLVRDDAERKLPRAKAIIEAEDPESGRTFWLDLSDSIFAGKLSKSADEYAIEAERIFRKLGLDHINAKTGQDFHRELSAFFRKRERRKLK